MGVGKMEQQEQEISLDVRDIIRIIKKRFWFIVLVSLGFAIVGGLINVYVLIPQYQSRISIVIGKTYDKSLDITSDYTDVMMYQSLMKTYAQIAGSATVAKEAAQILITENKLDPSLIYSSIGISPQTDTQIMDMSATDRDPAIARDVVTAYAKAFMVEAKRIFPEGNIQIIDPAGIPNGPISPQKKKNVMIAFLLGLMVSGGISFLLEFLDNTLKNESAVERIIGLPVIGVIPRDVELK